MTLFVTIGEKIKQTQVEDLIVDDNKLFTLLSMALGLLTLIARYLTDGRSRKRSQSGKHKETVDQAQS